MKNILSFLLLLAAVTGRSQQLNTSGFYELFTSLHNPAMAGSGSHSSVGASFKKQWSGMPGGPQTSMVFGQTFLSKARLGVGGYLYNDVTGPTSRIGGQMAYAYHVPIKEKTSFSVGFEARLQELRFDRIKLQSELGLDPVATNVTNRVKADAGFGLAYYSPTLTVGASVSQLVQTRYKLYEMAGTTAEQSRHYRHYYFHGSYAISDGETKLVPNFLVVYLPNAPLEVQGGLRVEQNDLVWFGLNRRLRQGWMVQAGVRMKKFLLGYSFEIYNAPLTIFDKGSAGHELMLQYTWH